MAGSCNFSCQIRAVLLLFEAAPRSDREEGEQGFDGDSLSDKVVARGGEFDGAQWREKGFSGEKRERKRERGRDERESSKFFLMFLPCSGFANPIKYP